MTSEKHDIFLRALAVAPDKKKRKGSTAAGDPSPPLGGEGSPPSPRLWRACSLARRSEAKAGRGEGASPRVVCSWKHPSPRPASAPGNGIAIKNRPPISRALNPGYACYNRFPSRLGA